MRYAKYILPFTRLADLIMVNLAFLAGMYLRFDGVEKVFGQRYLTLLIGVNVGWLFISRWQKVYQNSRITPWFQIAGAYIKAAAFLLLFLLGAATLLKVQFVSREFLMYFFASQVLLQLGFNFFQRRFLHFIRRKGQNFRRIAILGKTESSIDFEQDVLGNPSYGFRFSGFYEAERTEVSKGWDDFVKDFQHQKVDELICSLAVVQELGVQKVLSFCGKNRIRVRFLSDVLNELRRLENARLEITRFYTVPLIVMRPEPLHKLHNRIIKRAFDLLLSIVLTLLFCWIYPICAILIKLSSKGPVIFKQKRIGMNGDVFVCYKFRTMRVNSGENQATRDDSRSFFLGKIMRVMRIDELPQLFNVIGGDMSIVGPRPHMMWQDEYYNTQLHNYSVRQFVKPGITGLAQSNGYHGETKELKLMKARVDQDLYYIQNWSLWLDLNIIIKTFRNLFKGFPEMENA